MIIELKWALLYKDKNIFLSFYLGQVKEEFM